MLLLWGCTTTSPPKADSNGTTTAKLPPVPSGGAETQPTPSSSKCPPSYLFGEVANGTLGHTSHIVATVSCLAGKVVSVRVGDSTLVRMVVNTNDSQTIDLIFIPPKDGTFRLSVDLDGSEIYFQAFRVSPLGSVVTTGTSLYDSISRKEWRTLEFETAGPLTITRAKVYIQRLDGYPTEANMVLDIRGDNGGVPGSILATVRKPLSSATMTPNWIKFVLSQPLQIPAGKYWAVLRLEQTGSPLSTDSYYVHYVVNDKQAEGNGYTRQMVLNVDRSGEILTETKWDPLSYDRTYQIQVQGS